MTRSETLLPDEPFGALVALTKVHFQDELRPIWLLEGNTMIQVTQDVEAAVFLGNS